MVTRAKTSIGSVAGFGTKELSIDDAGRRGKRLEKLMKWSELNAKKGWNVGIWKMKYKRSKISGDEEHEAGMGQTAGADG